MHVYIGDSSSSISIIHSILSINIIVVHNSKASSTVYIGTKGTAAAILPAIDRMLKNEEYLVSNINNLSCIHITALPTLSAIIPHRHSTVRAFRQILFVTCLPTHNNNNDRTVPSAPTTMSKSTLQIQHAYKTHRFWLFGGMLLTSFNFTSSSLPTESTIIVKYMLPPAGYQPLVYCIHIYCGALLCSGAKQ